VCEGSKDLKAQGGEHVLRRTCDLKQVQVLAVVPACFVFCVTRVYFVCIYGARRYNYFCLRAAGAYAYFSRLAVA
jgi:hypothetical protein